MPETAHKERTKSYSQLAAGLAFFSIGKILPAATQTPIVGALAGVEGFVLFQNILGKDVDPNTFATSCLETGAICFLVGGSAAVAAPYLFAAGFLTKTLASSVRAYRDPENKNYHLLDAGVGLVQSAGVGIGLIGGVAEKVNTGIAGAASLLGGFKSLFYSFKAPEPGEEGPGYQALKDPTSGSRLSEPHV